MRSKGLSVVVEGCDVGSGGADLRVRSISVIASSKVVGLRNGTWDAVVRSAGKGTFLIRCQKNSLSSQCPLLCCEVRHVEDVGGRYDSADLGQEVEAQSGEEGIARRPADEAVLARAFHSTPRGCDKDETGAP